MNQYVEELVYQLHNAYCPFDHAGPYVACEHFTEEGDDQPAMLGLAP